MDSIPQKCCSKCGETKPLTEFSPDKRRIDGRSSHCRQCHRSYEVLHPRPLKPKLQSGDSKTCNRCGTTKPVEQFVRCKDGDGYRNQCKGCHYATTNTWRAQNKEHRREYDRRNYDRLSQQQREWAARNHDRILAKRRLRYKTPRALLYARLRAHERRVVKSGTVTPDQIAALHQQQGRCYYCKKPFNNRRNATIDHVIPLSKGGQHNISNIVLACWPCNNKKRAQIVRLL